LRLAHFDLIAVSEVVVEGLVEHAVVNDVVQGSAESEDLSVPIEILGTENVEGVNDLLLSVAIKALSLDSVVNVLVHSTAITGN
jgi:urease gamma subunit